MNTIIDKNQLKNIGTPSSDIKISENQLEYIGIADAVEISSENELALLNVPVGAVAYIIGGNAWEKNADGTWKSYGSGGGGDFSTAEVTLVNNTNERVASDNYIPMLSEEELTAQPIGASANRSTTSIIVTYKGKAYIEFDTGYNISIEGDAEVTDESLVTVSGDCTLTFN